MKLAPLAQQRTALDRARNKPYFAFFMEQGTGKAYVGLAEAEQLFTENKIDLLVVVAPNGVQRNWLSREAPKLLSVPFTTLLWQPAATLTFQRTATAFAVLNPRTHLKIFAVNVEAFSRKKSRAELFTLNLMKRLRTLLILDESSVIKNLSTARTRNVLHLRDAAPYRRIETGTPVTQSPLNFFPQFEFLRPGLLGFTQYVPFKSFYAVWRDRQLPSNKKGAPPGTKVQFKELVRFRNLPHLKAKVDQHSYTVRKADCLDLPPKVYQEFALDMSPEQAALYAAARKQFIVELAQSKERMTIAHAFTRLTRLSQITGGFQKSDSEDEAQPIPGENPKISALQQYIEELPAEKKVVIWARFTPELRAIRDALGAAHCALYWGEIDQQSRHENVDRFQDPTGPARFFVGNAACGKFGLTLTAASHVLYFSNSFSADARWQSEDRCHRIGQSESVTYTDLTCHNTVDTRILKILLARADLAAAFKGDAAALARAMLADDEEETAPLSKEHFS